MILHLTCRKISSIGMNPVIAQRHSNCTSCLGSHVSACNCTLLFLSVMSVALFLVLKTAFIKTQTPEFLSCLHPAVRPQIFQLIQICLNLDLLVPCCLPSARHTLSHKETFKDSVCVMLPCASGWTASD